MQISKIQVEVHHPHHFPNSEVGARQRQGRKRREGITVVPLLSKTNDVVEYLHRVGTTPKCSTKAW